MQVRLQFDYERVARFCRERGIRKLSLFGSVLRDDYEPERSDIDVLAEFLPSAHPGLRFFGYGEELGEILGGKVDFNTSAWLGERFLDEAQRGALVIYEQA